jgi:hypothetical protein
MHRGLAGGLERPFQHVLLQVDQDDVARLQLTVVEGAGGDEDVALGGAGTDVARGPGDEARDHLAGDPGDLFA